MRKQLTFAAQAVVSVALLALLFRRLDISALRTLYTLAKIAEDQELIQKTFAMWVHNR